MNEPDGSRRLSSVFPARKLFWPYIVTALLTVLLSAPRLISQTLRWDVETLEGTALSACFGLILLLLALLRSRLGSCSSDGLALLLCSMPFLLSLLLGRLEEPDTEGAYVLANEMGLGAIGATFSLGLVVSELVTNARFAGGSVRRGVTKGLLLALPFQLPWLARVAPKVSEWIERADEDALTHFLSWLEWPSELIVPSLALILIPLSLRRGGVRAPALVAGLGVASLFAFVQREFELVRDTVFFIGCTPATHLEILEGTIRELAINWLEPLAFILPAFAIIVAVLWPKRRVALGACGVALLIASAHAFTVARLDRLNDTLSASKDFIPRSRGNGGGALLISPRLLTDEESLGKRLADAAQLRELSACWQGPYRGTIATRVTSVSFDARLTREQELAVAQTARRHGVQALEVIEGEARGPEGSRYLLTTHLRRLLASWVGGTFFLGSTPSGCRAPGVTSTMAISERNQGEGLLELPEE